MTKLAAHIQEGSDAAAEHLRRALYPAIKCMGNTTPAWLREKVLPEYDQCGVPRPFIWRREWVDDAQYRTWALEGIAGAAKFFEATVRGYDDWRSLTDVIESGNEFIDWSDDDMRRLDEMESELVRLYHVHGNRVIGGNFAVGWPKLDHWPFYSATMAHVDFLGLHEYAWPEGVDGNDGQSFLWHAWRVMRFKKARQVILSHGMRLPPIILTEIGWDRAVWQGGNAGFRNAPDPNAYYAWLTGYDARVSPDTDVRYCAIFQTGAAADWREKGFDIVGHYVGNVLADYTRVDALQLPPEPLPLPPSEPDEPTLDDVSWGRNALGSWPATMKDARLHGEEWIMQDPEHEWRYISRNSTNDVYYVIALDPQTWERVRATPLGQTSDLL